jgi:dihydroflavonol-4-reductase
MILVTGASGFIGRHLVRYLSGQGLQVRALYHSHAPGEALKNLPGISWTKCDLLDIYDVEEAMEGIEEVYHCAAIVSFLPRDRERLLHFNVESTANIVNQALEQGIRKMVYLSSVAALGRNELTKEITEEEQWEESKYNSIYALSKHLAETEVWRGIGEGLNAVIVNPGIVLGEGDWDNGSARLMKLVFKEFPFYTSGINAWVDVQDVVKAMAGLMNSDVAAERFILSQGNYAYKEVFGQMAKALNKKPPHIRANGFMTGMVWRWNKLRNMIFGETVTVTKETARTSQKKVFYNNSKLGGFLPGFSYTPLDKTIERMAAVFLSEQKLKN